jgi:nitroimidazol reductase NimA-like FMN-containing flavoprotein (pyridoxamine 5'-phosphate oxidase superfamily)
LADDATLEELPESECLELLGSHSVGRIAVVVSGQPLIFPVNYVLDGRTLAFRTDPGTKLEAATLGRVAFEIDGFDQLYHSGWSVVVQGIGQEITDAFDEWSERVRGRALEPWAAGAKDHWVAISSPKFTGRRIKR